MGRLIAFGDSWTGGHGVETDIQYKEVIDCGEFTNKLRIMNSWVRYLATHLDVPYVNLGWCNMSNPEIVDKIKENIDNLEQDDIIVVMLSYAYRGTGEPTKDVGDINRLLKGYNYYIVNSFYPTFENVRNISKVDLTRFLHPHNTFAEFLVHHEEALNESVWEYGFRKVNREGSFLGGDYHPNTKGYKIIAWELYNRINNL